MEVLNRKCKIERKIYCKERKTKRERESNEETLIE